MIKLFIDESIKKPCLWLLNFKCYRIKLNSEQVKIVNFPIMHALCGFAEKSYYTQSQGSMNTGI